MDKQERGICHPGHACKVALEVKNLPANSGDVRDTGSMPGWGRCPGGGNGTLLQDSCRKNPMDRGAWRAIVRGVAEKLDMTELLSTYWDMALNHILG